MDEKKERSLRRRAIRWTLDGMRSSIILKRLGRSRAWLSKWKKHFDQVGWEGLRSKSRSPHVVAHRYDGRTRRLVIQARRRLERRKVGLIGPRAIQTELRQTRLLRRIPGRSTIKRMLHEAGLIKAAHPAREVYFPQPSATPDYVLYAMDWTSKFLTGGCKVFAFHTLDLETRALQQTISADKSLESVERHALETWRVLGLPDGLQMDNDAAFCGGYKAPRVFGRFIRLCLYFGIEPIFIPPYEAEWNGVIERTNGLWNQSFWRRQHFNSLAAVERASPKFEQWYAQHYEPPTLNGSTPVQAQRGVKRLRVTARQIRALPAELPITEGRLHFIRPVDQGGLLSLLNENWKVDKRLAGEYVWATLLTHKRQLKIYHRRSADDPVRLIKTFHYEISEAITPLLPEFKRSHRRRNMFTML